MSDTTRTYTTLDKGLLYGPGPWEGEPDKVQWIDEATGLDCLVVRGGLGAWCGYVGVPPGHPYHGLYMEEVPMTVHAHGGLTFAASCDDEGDEATAVCHVPEPGRPADVWWLGFDCAHAGTDVIPQLAALGVDWSPLPRPVYRTVNYAMAQVRDLARQLEAIARDV